MFNKNKKKSELEIQQEKLDKIVAYTNKKIDRMGESTDRLYTVLNQMQNQFDKIRNIPEEKKIEYERIKKVRLEWRNQVKKIEEDYKKAMAVNTGAGATGVAAGVAVVAMGPTTAMGIATTFGVASTGTAISALSGAAATNAALAWLGGGALAAGGGGMAAGNALLALAGPIGWGIAGVSLAASGMLFLKSKKDKDRLEEIFILITKRDINSYQLATTEIYERITRIQYEADLLEDGLSKIKSFGLNYENMTEEQQYKLGSYFNLMSSSTQLLVNPIKGLQPKYSEIDFEKFKKANPKDYLILEQKKLIIIFANLLYKIKLDAYDRKLLKKSFKNNDEFLNEVNVEKSDIDEILFILVDIVLEYKYKTSKI